MPNLVEAMYDRFEHDLNLALGQQMKEDDSVCRQVWSALANVAWYHSNTRVAYTFRAAGALIASIIGRGNYMEWYCSGPDGHVSEFVKDALSKFGWSPALES